MTCQLPILWHMIVKWKAGPNVIKLFLSVIYEFLLKARVFVHVNPFQPSLMCADKARACMSEPPFWYSTNILGSWPYHKH
jgi:hypothetical protein